MNFTSPLEILVSSFKLKLLSWKGGSTVKLWIVTNSTKSSLRALYAQLFWITLAPSVLPRLLAQNWPGLLPWVSSSSIKIFTIEQTVKKLHKKTKRSYASFNCFLYVFSNPKILSQRKRFTTKRAFIPHAKWLDQACAHCPRFLTAASRKSMGRVSVPLWLIILSNQLKIIGLGGF